MMTLTRYGIREWGGGLAVAVVLGTGFVLLARYGWPITGWSLLAATCVVYFAIAAFFRNPWRSIPRDEMMILSAADGVVRDIEVVEFTQEPFQGKALRIGVFLSVFNVHVNRAPAEFAVINSVYRAGHFLDARDERCVKENEAMTIAGMGSAAGIEFPLAVRQISGAIARRIVCPVQPGRKLAKGEIYGMIKFGSRTEIYLPTTGFDVLVKVGDRVRGGLDAVARIKKEA